ncbi:MAG: Type 1 glutamine amidotransferase-like domain-containing protein [Patescibacteria group bacterium]
MTKYILNSGGSKNQPEKAILFHQEIIKGLGKTPRVLFCFFAEKRGYWEEKFAVYGQRFLDSMSQKISPQLELAMPDKFIEQLKNNDAIIIHGGDDYLLQSWLKQYEIPNIWKDKVVAASSAGSNALAKYFWTCDWRQCLDGLGILPIKFLPHYKSSYGESDPRGLMNWDKAYQELAAYGDKSLPIYALEEGDFIIIEK